MDRNERAPTLPNPFYEITVLCLSFRRAQSGPGGDGGHLPVQEALHHPHAGADRELPVRERPAAQPAVHAAAAAQCLPQAGRHPAGPRPPLRALQHAVHPQRHGERVRRPRRVCVRSLCTSANCSTRFRQPRAGLLYDEMYDTCSTRCRENHFPWKLSLCFVLDRRGLRCY